MSYSHKQYIFTLIKKKKQNTKHAKSHLSSNLKKTLEINIETSLSLSTITFWARYFVVLRGCPMQYHWSLSIRCQ